MTLDDDACMEAIAAGDPEAARLLVERYERPLYHYLLKMLRDPHAARDLFQEVFVVVCRRHETYVATGRFRSWLFAIAANLVMRELARRRRSTPVDFSDPSVEERLTPDLQEGPEHEAVRRDFHEAVNDGLERLQEEHRSAILLRDVLGFQYEEMARTLDVPIGTVRSRLARARESLSQFLSKRGFSPQVKAGGDSREP